MDQSIVLVGLPGVSGSSLAALMEAGQLPLLKGWSTGAVRSGVEFPQPVSSVAAWTTLVTGKPPAEHGIFDLFRKQSPQGHQLRALTSRDLTSDALWTTLNREGKRTTVLDFPLTVPPPRIEGHIMPGSWATRRQLKMSCHPSDLSRRINMEPFALDWPVQIGEDWIKAQIDRDNHVFETLASLRQDEPSDLTVLLVRTAGALQQSPAYLGALDEHLAGLVRTGDNLILVSEPGGSILNSALNQTLADNGYLVWAEGHAPEPSERKALDTDQLTRQAKLIDWTKTRAYSPLAGSNEIYVVASEPEYDSTRNALIALLAQEPQVGRVWKREELYTDLHCDLAPDLVLETKGACQGIFMAAGPLFQGGELAATVSLLDIAPLVFYGLGMEIPADLEGRFPKAAIKATWLDEHPVRLALQSSKPAAERVLDPEAEAIVLKRLQDLGYLD